MTSTVTHSAVSDTALPLPRLVLRVGGLGNRHFGSANGIAEDPGKISTIISDAVEEILIHTEVTLKSLHQEDQTSRDHHWPAPISLWRFWKKIPGLIMHTTDRWGINRIRETLCPVFTRQPPLITLLTGDTFGADTLLETITQKRPPECGVEYSRLQIKAEAPEKVSNGLGIGSIPEKLPEAPVHAAQSLSAITRREAEERAIIARQRAFGFRAQSEALRHHSDILIAIWDPHAEGKAGGTSESVAAALNERIPVIAVRVLGEELCDIRVLNSSEHLRALNGITTTDALPSGDWRPELTTLLTNLLRFPDPSPGNEDHQHHTDKSYHPRAAFQLFREGKPLDRIWTARFWSLYEAFSKYRSVSHGLKEAKRRGSDHTVEDLAKLKSEHRAARSNVWKAITGQFGWKEPAELTARPANEIQEATYACWYKRVRERASSAGMSGVFGDAHRGGILASYVFAAIAVLLAVIGGMLHYAKFTDGVLVAFAVAELLVIILMYSISEASKMEDWNMAYTESRIMAEALRMMEHLGPMGVHTPLPRLPYYLRGAKETPEPDRMWSVWYFRALVRMAPIRLHSGHIPSIADHRMSLEKLVEGQRTYHEKNAARQLAIHHDIESISGLLFVLVFLCVALQLADIANKGHALAAVGLLVCVGAPSLIAALHGLASQIEITRLHQRSASVAALLSEQYRRIEHLDFSKSPDNAETVWGYTAEVLSTASLLMDETAGWSMLYRNSDIHAG
ncbi:MAG: hypothetical protein ACK58L_14695 [Planctomycetota bacterium]